MLLLPLLLPLMLLLRYLLLLLLLLLRLLLLLLPLLPTTLPVGTLRPLEILPRFFTNRLLLSLVIHDLKHAARVINHTMKRYTFTYYVLEIVRDDPVNEGIHDHLAVLGVPLSPINRYALELLVFNESD